MKSRCPPVVVLAAMLNSAALGGPIVYETALRTVETQVVDPNVVNQSDSHAATGAWVGNIGGYGPNGGNEAISFQRTTLSNDAVTFDGFWASADLSPGMLGIVVGSAWARTRLDVTFTLADPTDFVLAYLPPLIGPGGYPTQPGWLNLTGNGVNLTLTDIGQTFGVLAPGQYRLQALAEASASAEGPLYNVAWFGFAFVVPAPGSALLSTIGAGVLIGRRRRRPA